MSFLRTFRSNLILSTAPPGNDRTMRNGSSNVKAATAAGTTKTTSSSGTRKHSTSGRGTMEDAGDGSDRAHSGRRASSATLQGRNGAKHSSSSSGSGRYGKENPAPIVVYLDKQQHQHHDERKQPASILRTNTFTKHDDEQEQRSRNAITRSDTFTINESSDETLVDSNTYSRHGTSAVPVTRDVFEPLYAKNIELSSHERLPVVVDSRTYRKKSLKSSKPVQKVESFIKRFERTLFSKSNSGGDAPKGRKNSSATSEVGGTGGPRFRDVGINCKLDEEEKFRAKLEAMRRSRQDSRDSLVSQRDDRRRSQSPTKRLLERGSTYDRLSASSHSNGVVVLPLKEDQGSASPSPPPEGGMGTRGSTLLRQTESSFLKSRQKEIEMGYSVVNKRQSGSLSLPGGSPERGKVNSGTWRTSRAVGYTDDEVQPRDRQYTTARGSASREDYPGDREDQNSLYVRYPFRTDTYRTLKEEYDEKQHQRQHTSRPTKPIGIASPRMNEARPGDRSPEPMSRKDSLPTDLPKYTFGTEQLQQRRSRFQQFQKSFQKMDDSASEVSVQQSFFVPI
ncbi:uncharacterized protein LOC131266203 [Anopheles coustani]|uniref:uncharacterized protein LOC131266203 n=1 Tax=Anopheles coustani TaxID=139045 RepID=UPI00265A140B|nr:uncharacterized protein LOC131266203 [Anopheles coustani]